MRQGREVEESIGGSIGVRVNNILHIKDEQLKGTFES